MIKRTQHHPLRRILSLFTILCLFCSVFVPPAYAAEPSKSRTEELSQIFTTAELMDATVEELQAAMDSGRLTSVQLTQMYLDRINAYNSSLGLNTIININPDALARAEDADEARAKGKSGRLLGIPVIVKDNLDVLGMATTCGDTARAKSIATKDSTSVARLKEEGAIILAKANMSEYANYGCHSRSSIAGRVHNAYDLARTPAGSSGGSAVAVTANFCAVALGSDTGSSIRRPSSFANLYGLRPSFGLVSVYGLYALNTAKDTVGPICRSMEDLSLLMDIMAGTDSKDSRTASADSYLPTAGYVATAENGSLKGKRIGYLKNSFGYYSTSPSSLMTDMISRAKATFTNCGATLVDMSSLLSESTISGITSSNALTYRTKITKILKDNNIDAVIYVSQMNLPQLETAANDSTNNSANYINIFGPICGLPDIMLPMGTSKTNSTYTHAMPLGLSMFSGYGQDDVLIALASAFETATNNRVQPWTVPALPDSQLSDFAEKLIADCIQITPTDYTDESVAAMNEACRYLQSIRMKTENELVAATLGKTVSVTDSRTAVSTEAYLSAVNSLAVAFDALVENHQPTLQLSSGILTLKPGTEAVLLVSAENLPTDQKLSLVLSGYEAAPLSISAENTCSSATGFLAEEAVLSWQSTGAVQTSLASLRITAAEDIPISNYTLTLTLRTDDDVICSVSCLLSISPWQYGDANGDDVCNGQDLIRLRNYLLNLDPASNESTEEIFPGADANGDGVINGKDLLLLTEYLLNQDPVTGTSTVILGPQESSLNP